MTGTGARAGGSDPPPPPPAPTGSASTGPAQLLHISISDAQAMVPIYDGNSEELHRFIVCCEALLKVSKNNADRNLFFDIIKTRLTGVAYDVLKYNAITSWEQLKKELNAQFQEERPRCNIQSELMRLKQGPKESVKNFSQRINKLLGELNDSTLAETIDQATKTYLLKENEMNAIKAFEDGLYYEQLGILAKAAKETSLRKLIVYVIEHSLRVNDSNTSRNHPSTSVQTPPEYCNYCKKPGHKYENCFQRRKLPIFTPQASVPVKRELNRIFCTYCKKSNHQIHECRSRIRNEQARNQQQTRNQPQAFKRVMWSVGETSENDLLREEESGPSSRIIQTQAQIHNHPEL